MLTFFIVASSIALMLLCAWLLLLILMQKPSANAGMGAALGGGAAGSVFGGEASNVLTRWTVYGVIGFFILTLSLSLMQIYQHHHREVVPELAPMAEEESKPGSLTQLPSSVSKKSDTTKKQSVDSQKNSSKAPSNLPSNASSAKPSAAKR